MSILCLLLQQTWLLHLGWICIRYAYHRTKSFRMPQFFCCSWAYNTIHKFLNQIFKSFVDSFGSWCIFASLLSVIRQHQWQGVPVTLVRSSSSFQIFNDFENLQLASKLHLKFWNCRWKPLLRYGFKCSQFNFYTQMIWFYIIFYMYINIYIMYTCI